MAFCYCANYYGSINCHNSVSKFGDRCALCVSTRAGRSSSISANVFPQANDQWVENAKREQLRRQESETRRQRMKQTVN